MITFINLPNRNWPNPQTLTYPKYQETPTPKEIYIYLECVYTYMCDKFQYAGISSSAEDQSLCCAYQNGKYSQLMEKVARPWSCITHIARVFLANIRNETLPPDNTVYKSIKYCFDFGFVSTLNCMYFLPFSWLVNFVIWISVASFALPI